MKINLHSMYHNPSFTWGRIPQYLEWVESGGELDCYVDVNVTDENISKKSIALVIEPRSIQPSIYEYLEKNGHRFRYVFTHDSILLKKLDNAKLILFGGVYDECLEPKTKDISIVSSNKDMCELHKIRTDICKRFESNPYVDCYGTYNGGSVASTRQILGAYKFSIIIENYRDDYWFTEKICNCFANRVIPIYYGAKKITKFFNRVGIIELDDPYDCIQVVKYLDVNKEYLKRFSGIIYNYELVKRFKCFEDWFHTEYKELLEEMINE